MHFTIPGKRVDGRGKTFRKAAKATVKIPQFWVGRGFDFFSRYDSYTYNGVSHQYRDLKLVSEME